MRSEPSEKTEMVSQLLFGETYSIVEQFGNWIRIESETDHYTGWIDSKQHTEISPTFHHRILTEPSKITTALIGTVFSDHYPVFHIVRGSHLPCYDDHKHFFSIEDKFYRYKPSQETHQESISLQNAEPQAERILSTAYGYLGTPYLWGGRSPFGIDCSGFTQMVYKINGYSLMRDSSQQAEQGKAVESIGLSLPGDLAFFCNSEGKITHTGIIVNENKIIHCSGFVRIDFLDEKGIYNTDNDKYTHLLCLIRRITW